MPFNGTGTFVREFNWSNDAANNIPISASRFDGEDNDFASGLSLCLTRDGQGVPTQPLTWSQALTINVASDIAAVTGGRTGGVNNPSLQLKLTDAVGGQLNLTTAQTLGLAIQGTSVISMTSTAVNITQALTVALDHDHRPATSRSRTAPRCCRRSISRRLQPRAFIRSARTRSA